MNVREAVVETLDAAGQRVVWTTLAAGSTHLHSLFLRDDGWLLVERRDGVKLLMPPGRIFHLVLA